MTRAAPLKKQARPRGRRRWYWQLLFWLATTGFVVAIIGMIAGFFIYRHYATTLPDLNTLTAQQTGGARIEDRNGNLIYEFAGPDGAIREHTPLDAMSPYLISATLATEDPSFYSNPGFDVRGIARALWENLRPGDTFLQGSGGSGVTQQLVKNLIIPESERGQRSLRRKAQEAVLAIEITRRYSKDQILEWYLNTIFYGNNAYGAGAAAHRYFDKDVADLTLAEAALLAGIPQAPARFDPTVNPDAALARRAEVLAFVQRRVPQYREEALAAQDAPLELAQRQTTIEAPHWVFYIQEQLEARFGSAALLRSGLRVTTTLDLPLQHAAQAAVRDRVTEFEEAGCGCHNGAAVVIDNATGQVLAMVGSRDFNNAEIQGEVNNATAVREPGSALKPFVYLATFLKDWTPATVVWDIPKTYPNPGGEPFTPVGPTSAYQGPVTVRQALGSSLNAPAVRAAETAGVAAVVDTARKMGVASIGDEGEYGVSIATGGSHVTLLDLTYGYTTLANNGALTGLESRANSGRRLDPVTILKVVDARGRTLYEAKNPRREQVVPAPQAAMVTDILADDSARRLIYQPGIFDLRDKRPVAAKTGTQQGATVDQVRATWNFGYTPELTVGVWVGNTDGTLLRNISSANTSLRIWKDVMQAAVDGYQLPPSQFARPDGLQRVRVNIPSGGDCRTVEDLAPSNRTPSDGCSRATIDSRNNLLATDATPPEFLREVVFVEGPDDARSWAERAGYRLGRAPREASPITPVPTPTPSPTPTPGTPTPMPNRTSTVSTPSASQTPPPAATRTAVPSTATRVATAPPATAPPPAATATQPPSRSNAAQATRTATATAP